MYAKNKDEVSSLSLPPDPGAESRITSSLMRKLAIRGSFRVKPLEATKSMDARENLIYSIPAPDGGEVWPKRQWWWAKDRAYAALENNELYFTKDKKGEWSISYKQYLRDDSGEERRSKPFSILDGPYTQVGSALLREIFSEQGREIFQFPKPVELIERLITMLPLPDNAIFLDSFAGSGTLAHAVLKTNQQDQTKHRFILVEMLDYAQTITAERVRRVSNGYGEGASAVAPVGGGFDFYTIGEPIFTQDGLLNDAVGLPALRNYITYVEGIPSDCRIGPDNPYSPHLLGLNSDAAWLFNYDPDDTTCLNLEYLATLNFCPNNQLRPSSMPTDVF